MKLRNKKTGEILELCCHRSGDYREKYNSLAELNEEWEDAPEKPKEYWCIDWTEPDGIYRTVYKDEWDDFNKEIGNYFDTREEAEKAVEKLKAWKRLKDKGYRFSKWFTRVEGGIQINMEYNKYDGIDSECRNDLNLLFGGEE